MMLDFADYRLRLFWFNRSRKGSRGRTLHIPEKQLSCLVDFDSRFLLLLAYLEANKTSPTCKILSFIYLFIYFRDFKTIT